MRRRTLPVLGIALGILASIGYLGQQLRIERARTQELSRQLHDLRARLAAPVATAMPVQTATTDANPAAAATTNAQSSVTTRPAGAPGAGASEETAASRLASERLARTRALHAIELQRFEDPVARKVMRDEVRMQIRRMKPDLGKEIGLTTAEEEAALLELLAEQELRLTEFGYRHGRASEEERRAWNQQVEQANEEHEQQLADFLGPERLERYRKYGDTGAERQQVKELRSRLDESNTLSDAQAARLVATMYEERRRYVEEMEQYMHGKDYAYDAGYPFRAMAVTERPAARLQFAEEEAGRIEAFMKRLHDRAAIVLSAEQLRRFDELQEEHMTAVRASVEGWRAENAAAGQRQR